MQNMVNLARKPFLTNPFLEKAFCVSVREEPHRLSDYLLIPP